MTSTYQLLSLVRDMREDGTDEDVRALVEEIDPGVEHVQFQVSDRVGRPYLERGLQEADDEHREQAEASNAMERARIRERIAEVEQCKWKKRTSVTSWDAWWKDQYPESGLQEIYSHKFKSSPLLTILPKNNQPLYQPIRILVDENVPKDRAYLVSGSVIIGRDFDPGGDL